MQPCKLTQVDLRQSHVLKGQKQDRRVLPAQPRVNSNSFSGTCADSLAAP